MYSQVKTRCVYPPRVKIILFVFEIEQLLKFFVEGYAQNERELCRRVELPRFYARYGIARNADELRKFTLRQPRFLPFFLYSVFKFQSGRVVFHLQHNPAQPQYPEYNEKHAGYKTNYSAGKKQTSVLGKFNAAVQSRRPRHPHINY